MFLTRIGFGSKAVITGDATQVDMPGGKSGLAGLEPLLEGIDGVAFVRLTGSDVVRHRIVQDIVNAYDQRDAERAATEAARELQRESDRHQTSNSESTPT